MEAAAEGDHARAAGRRARDLDRVLDGFGAGGEEGGLLGEVARRARVDLLGDADIALVRHDLVAGVAELVQLLGDRALHLVVQVAGVEYADAAGKVDVAAALAVPQLGVLRALGEEVAHHAHAARGGLGLAFEKVFAVGHGLPRLRCSVAVSVRIVGQSAGSF